MSTPEPLMPIGQFSRLTRLSVRMLRHYDEHGVLTPAEIDHWTGHRHYSLAQAERAQRIRQLRDVGFGVAAIAALLDADAPTVDGALHRRRHELIHELQISQSRLQLVNALIEGESTMSFTLSDVQITTRAAMSVVALRGIIPEYSAEGLLWQKFSPELQRQQIQAIGPGGVLEHKDYYQERDVDCSVWVPVDTATSCREPLERIDLPSTEVAEVQLKGAYSHISEAISAIVRHCEQRQLQSAGGAYNIYLTDPAQTPAEENLTRVGIPVRPRSTG